MGDDDKLDRTAARLMDDWRETNESWTQLIERIDAALRRAKAEGMREAGKIARANAELLRPPSRQFELNMVNKAKSEEAGMIADELDARAAQIEEGA